MQADQPFDNLIIFHAVSTIPDSKVREPEQPQNNSTNEDIINIYWASYNVQGMGVETEWEYFIKPSNFIALSAETIEKTKLTNEELQEKGVSLGEAIQHFNETMYINYTSHNLSFCIVTNNDNLLTNLLPKTARNQGFKLPSHFQTFFNVQDEVKKVYQINTTQNSLQEYLLALELPSSNVRNQCQAEGKNILTLIHDLCLKGHVFNSPKNLNAQYQLIVEKHENPSTINTFRQVSSIDDGVFGSREKRSKFFVKMRGLLFSAREPEISKFLQDTNVNLEDIVISYGRDGRVSGEAYVQFFSEEDFMKALSLNRSHMGSRYIEIFESDERDYEKAKSFQKPNLSDSLSHLINENVGVLRMRGLPYSCTDNDIYNFFSGFTIVKEGIKREIKNGRPGGECYVIFETQEQAHMAMGRNLERIGNRFIELFESGTKELKIFLSSNFDHNNSFSRENLPYVAPEKKKCCLMMVGLPYSVAKNDVINFFRDFELKESNVFLISNKNRKFSGSALVTFRDEGEAQRALKNMNLSYIGGRYVELYEFQ